jgi:hypothetical protein
VNYLNSGDWVENLSALEYTDGKWTLFHFEEAPELQVPMENGSPVKESSREIFDQMWKEFQLPVPAMN